MSRPREIQPAGDPAEQPEGTLAGAPEPPEDEATARATLEGARTLADGPTLDGPPGETTAAGTLAPTIPGYEILRELGRGGMGVVYQALEVRLNRPCAVKMILAGAHASGETTERFRVEAESAARIQHPNIVQVYHVGDARGLPFVEMEYVGGGSLDRRLDGTPWPSERAARMVERLARGVAEAHRLGIVHRDLKPANILLAPDADQTPKIADFGLAKLMDGESGLTRTEMILGSPSYMAPEQAEGKAREVGPPADVYALGAILYELLTGRPPFRGATLMETLEQVKHAEVVPPSRLVPRLPRDLETIALVCLRKEPPRRYASAPALAEDLRRFREGEPILARRSGPARRAWRWCRRNRALAGSLAAVAVLLVFLAVGAAVAAARSRRAADRNRELASRETAARIAAVEDRKRADDARNAALADAYRATFSEAHALRAAHLPGWRDVALRNLARLAGAATPRRDPVELRTEAVAALGEFDVRKVVSIEGLVPGIVSVDFSPDGWILATSLRSGGLHLWDVARPQYLAQIVDPRVTPAAEDATAQVARFLPDGVLAYAAGGRSLAFLDPSGRSAPRPPIDGRGAMVRALAVAPIGRLFAVGWSDGRIGLHDADTGVLRRTLRGRPAPLALSPDGRLLAMQGPDSSVWVYQADQDGPPVRLGRPGSGVFALAFDPAGATVAIAASDSVELWDVGRREERLTLRGHDDLVNDIAFSPVGDLVATTSDDHTARIWGARNGRMLAVLPGRWTMRGVAFSPDGSYLAVGNHYATSTVGLYQVVGRRECRRLIGHRRGAQSVAFDPRHDRLATGADDARIITWDPDAARPLWQRGTDLTYVAVLAYSPDGSLLASGNGRQAEEYTVRLWDAETGALRRSLSGHRNGIIAAAFDPEGRRLATGDDDGVVLIWDVATGRILRRELLTPGWARSVAFVDGGRRLLVGGGDTGTRLELFDLDGAGLTRHVDLPDGWGRFVVDERRGIAIVGGSSGALTAVTLPDLKIVHRLANAHEGIIWTLALSPDGSLLATGAEDRRIVLRDPRSLEPLLTFPEWLGVVKSLAFDRSGRRLAIAGVASDIAVWDLGLVREGLAATGLAWDRAAGTIAASADLPEATIPILRPGNVDRAALDAANRLVDSGYQALKQGRMDEAIRDLTLGRDRLAPMHRAAPVDRLIAGSFGVSHVCLGGARCRIGQPAQALDSYRNGVAVLAAMPDPQMWDLYNLACGLAQMSALGAHESPPIDAEAREALAVRSVETLRRAIAAGMREFDFMDRDHDLDSLRDRADFLALKLDAGFPGDPFAPPSPIEAARSRPAPTPIEPAPIPEAEAVVGIGLMTKATADGLEVILLTPGGLAAEAGRLAPGDTILGAEELVLFAGKDPVEIQSHLRGGAGSKVRLLVRPQGTDRREVHEFTRRPVSLPPDPTPRARTDEARARRAAEALSLVQRGGLLGRRSDWKAALDDYRRALELDPSDSSTWLHLAPLYLRIGDVEGHRRHVRAMAARFGDAGVPESLERTAKAALLAPPPPADLPQLVEFAERALELRATSPNVHWFRLARGMAAYRAGQFDRATEELGRVVDSNVGDECKTTAVLFRAMTRHRLGQPDDARRLLDRAARTLDAVAEGGDPGGAWPDWLIADLARREAQALIAPGPVR